MVLKPKLPHPVCILEVLMLVPGIIVAKHNAMQYNSEKKEMTFKAIQYCAKCESG